MKKRAHLACLYSQHLRRKEGGSGSWPVLVIQKPFLKRPTSQKRYHAWECSSVAECSLSLHKALIQLSEAGEIHYEKHQGIKS